VSGPIGLAAALLSAVAGVLMVVCSGLTAGV
jgi:thioredoxin reductase